MEEQYQRVDPTPFDAPSGSKALETEPEAARSSLLIPGLVLLGVIALGVVFVLPMLVSTNEPNVSADASKQQSDGAASAGTNSAVRSETAKERTSEPSSPFADAVEAKARAEAQDLLAELLDVQENLIERGAETWAADSMISVAERARLGDEQYRARDFEAAIESYEAALGEALALEQSIPERVAGLQTSIIQRIESLDEALAREELALALLMDPFEASLEPLGARVERLAALVPEVELAREAEEAAEIASAVDAWERANAVDPEHVYVEQELARARSELLEQRFNTAMSEGYAALDVDDFVAAKQRFGQAQALKPASPEASAALQELAVARTASQLRSLQQRGEGHVTAEDWQSAADVYTEALTIDAGLRFAREGLALAEPRAELDSALQAILAKPERLVDEAILREAQNTLAKAEQIDGAGKRLEGQIIEVAEILRVASTPIAVTIQSDGETSIIVYKVARLGAIDERRLELRPGTYTAVGSRRGFRDKRIEFTVTPAGIAPIYLACNETI
ncbi:MAG: hypothetical protein AAF098_08080 [Pseudomonadota bacterium]